MAISFSNKFIETAKRKNDKTTFEVLCEPKKNISTLNSKGWMNKGSQTWIHCKKNTRIRIRVFICLWLMSTPPTTAYIVCSSNENIKIGRQYFFLVCATVWNDSISQTTSTYQITSQPGPESWKWSWILHQTEQKTAANHCCQVYKNRLIDVKTNIIELHIKGGKKQEHSRTHKHT